MWIQILCAVLASLLLLGMVSAAGRRFPDEGRKMTVEHFQAMNPSIEWDETFFLSDYSSRFSLCKYTSQPGIIRDINRRTPYGRQPITGIRAVTEGTRGTAYAANRYIRMALDSWQFDQQMRTMVMDSTAVGCSIRPMCRGQSVITCLFSGAIAPPPRTLPPTPPPTLPPTTRRTYPPPTLPPTPRPTQRPAPTPPTGIQRALAFTPQEYALTESVTGQQWDRSHLLENLSGYETLCEMIHTDSWPFRTATELGDYYGIFGLVGKYGYAPNLGSTPNGMREILQAWNWLDSQSFLLDDLAYNKVFAPDLGLDGGLDQGSGHFDPINQSPFRDTNSGPIKSVTLAELKDTQREIVFDDMGCSVIPDCIEPDGQMYVVVSCLFN